MIYLDNAATSFIKPDCVKKAMLSAMNSASSTGRSSHKLSRNASKIVYSTREKIADLVSLPNPENVIFTQNATHAINTALFGLLKRGDTLLISNLEHNAVYRPAYHLSKMGVEVIFAPCDEDGYIDIKALDELLFRKRVTLFCLIHASNVSGALNDIEKIAKITKQHGVLFMVDASQSMGSVPISMKNIDIMAFPGHKGLLGPQGTGCLLINDVALDPIIYGGTGSLSIDVNQPDFYPDRLEAGTLNVPSIAGLSSAVSFVKNVGVSHLGDKEKMLTNILINDLLSIKGVKLILPKKERVGVLSIVTKKDVSEVGEALSKEGVFIRSGLHCAPLAHEKIGTLKTGTIRFSPSPFLSVADVKKVPAILSKCLK